MKTNIHSILALMAAVLLWSPQSLFSQQVDTNPIELPSTSVWQQMKFNKTAGADLYTGTMRLSIPVFNYHDTDFDIPVSLDYSTNGYRPNVMTGVVGHEWSLGLGGAITRTVRGLPDEYRSASVFGFQELHRRHDIRSVDQIDGYNSEFDDLSIQAASPRIYYAPSGFGQDGEHIDMEPDIFQFSFLGRTGKFQLGYDGAIHVYDANTRNSEYVVEIPEYDLNRIVIVSGDGMRYTFGTGNARDRAGDHATAWKLARIDTPSGRYAEFSYTTSPRSTTGGTLTYTNFNSYAPDTHCYAFFGGFYDDWGGWHDMNVDYRPLRPVMGSVMMVSTPDALRLDNGTVVDFYYRNPTQLESGDGASLNNLPKLDRIVIKAPDGSVVRTCDLSYTYPEASSSNKLCFLSELSVSGEGSYTFDYNFNSSTVFPKHGTFKIDHWGYYNNSPVSASSFYAHTQQGDYLEETISSSLRDPVTAASMLGVMTAVHYPAGGSTTFEYEGNDYSSYEDNTGYPSYEPTMLSTPSRVARSTGGIRIKAIRDYTSSSSGTPSYSRTYSYRDVSGHSSGVRGPMPRYGLSYRKYRMSGDRIDVYLGSYNNLLPSDETHIEYRRITETHPQGSRVYEYITREDCPDGKETWYGSNIYNLTFTTEISPGISDETALDAIFALMSPRTSMQATRGRLISTETYDASGTLKQHVSTSYEQYAHAYETLEKTWNYQSLYLGAARVPTVIGDIRPLSTTSVTDGIADTETISYDRHRNIRTRTRGGQTSRYFYLQDMDDLSQFTDFTDYTWWNTFAAGSICARMKALNMVNCPLQTESYDENGVLHVLRYIYGFRTATDQSAVYLKSIQEHDGTTWRTVLSYDVRDSRGRILQSSDANGISTVYVWGYKGLYPIAEVVGATLAQVEAVSGLYNIESRPLESALSDSQASALRSLGEATVWEYSPLVGVSRETTPDGRSTSYTYSDSGKLYRVLNDLGKKTSANLYSTDNRQ